MKTIATMTIADFEALLGWPAKTAGGRLGALGLLVTCGRCAGSGRYSYNPMDGDRCFGCAGGGKRLPKLTEKLAAEVRARVDAGELEPYLARCRAKADARRQIKPLVAEIDGMWQGSALGRAYTKASLERKPGSRRTCWTIQGSHWNGARFVPAVLGYSPLFRANSLSGDIWWASKDIEAAVKHGQMGVERAVRELTEARDMLRTLYSIATPDQVEAWDAEAIAESPATSEPPAPAC